MHKRIVEHMVVNNLNHHNDILNRIYGDIQSLQQGLDNLAITVYGMDTKMDQRFNNLINVLKDLNSFTSIIHLHIHLHIHSD
ncbi:hypothetical protein CR513_58529, partial [Mucuna pruriens]